MVSGVDQGGAKGERPYRPALDDAALLIVRAPRQDDDMAALDRWLDEAEEHIDAYADTAAVWSELGHILPDWRAPAPPPATIQPTAEPEVIRSRLWPRSLAALSVAATLCISVFGWSWLNGPSALSTEIGEQRVVTLTDGTRLTLNTDSAVTVMRFDETRRVSLDRGEVLFDVAHNSSKPFLVEAMGRTVRVTGTSFVVRREEGRIDVTLLRGAVAVEQGAGHAVALKPGDRYREQGGVKAIVDRPSIDMVTAWRQGELLLDKTPLRDAVQEINRYTTHPIRFADAKMGELKLSGLFKTHEVGAFADTVAAIYGLRVERSEGRLLLVRNGGNPASAAPQGK